ncbi:glycosyltransferase family 2 protein [Bifidobacterium criceti]|uniref:Glycosyltransferase n=1 Tax=Bifidobacterium criceti TaxID=1960969 RepID=A0A2A2EJA7_9BIFI|nr:glycosyltransferase family 2 protein [Bifidobacterium criceti]PAU68998.1 Glycosyltransferase [Bifidobacterium criceti]
MKTLSIVIPAYNTGEHIAKLMTQLTSQANDEVEVLVIDDGSKDNTLHIAKRYANEYIRVIHQANQGVGPTRNHGIEKSNARYVWFVDADDSIADNAIELILRTIHEHPVDCYVFGYEKIFANKKTIVSNSQSIEYGSIRSIAQNFDRIFSESLVNVLWNKIFKLSVIKNNDIRAKKLRSGQDAEFCLRFFAHAESLYVCNQPIYKYVLMSSSSSSFKFQDTFFADQEAMYAALNDYERKTHAYVRGIKEFWKLHAAIGFYKNCYNSLPVKRYRPFRKVVKAHMPEYRRMIESLECTTSSFDIRQLVSASPFLSYLYIKRKISKAQKVK